MFNILITQYINVQHHRMVSQNA